VGLELLRLTMEKVKKIKERIKESHSRSLQLGIMFSRK